MSTINVRNVPEDLHRAIKAEAALQGITLEKLVIRIIQEYLEKRKGK